MQQALMRLPPFPPPPPGGGGNGGGGGGGRVYAAAAGTCGWLGLGGWGGVGGWVSEGKGRGLWGKECVKRVCPALSAWVGGRMGGC